MPTSTQPVFSFKKTKFRHNLECYMNPLAPEVAGWIAGIYEGEGSIIFRSNGNSRTCLRVSIAQKERHLGDTLIQLTGLGSVCENKSTGCYHWSVCNLSVIAFMKQIMPHMRIPYKIEQAIGALSNFVYDRSQPAKYARRPKLTPNHGGWGLTKHTFPVKPFVIEAKQGG